MRVSRAYSKLSAPMITVRALIQNPFGRGKVPQDETFNRLVGAMCASCHSMTLAGTFVFKYKVYCEAMNLEL